MKHLLIFLMFIFFPMIAVVGGTACKKPENRVLSMLIALMGLIVSAVVMHYIER